ncbi:MAG: hypothetical protein WC759_02765 [Candidatus Micrarchaeia archaeon]
MAENLEALGNAVLELTGKALATGETDAYRTELSVQYVTEVAMVSVDAPGFGGKTLLRLAVEAPEPNFGVVSMLLKKGAIADAKTLEIAERRLQEASESKVSSNKAVNEQGYGTASNNRNLIEAERVEGVMRMVVDSLRRERASQKRLEQPLFRQRVQGNGQQPKTGASTAVKH